MYTMNAPSSESTNQIGKTLEEDHQNRSTKRIKVALHQTTITVPQPAAKDVQTLYWDDVIDENTSDDESEEDIPTVKLSRDNKLLIRSVWVHSIILKPYGKSISYSYLDYKLCQT